MTTPPISPLFDALMRLYAVADQTVGRKVMRGAKPCAATLKMDRLREAVLAVTAALPEIPPDRTLVEIGAQAADPAQWAAMKLTTAMGDNAPKTVGEAHDLIAAVLRDAMTLLDRNRKESPCPTT